MGFLIRRATLRDIPFLVETIIEAEKSGTEILSYTTIFGLSVEETKVYIAQMLDEEIDHCELSVSSFMVAEDNDLIIAATGAWEEAAEGLSSSILKGNLLGYTLPQECFLKAKKISATVNELSIEAFPNTIQLGLVYVSSNHRGKGLVKALIDAQVNRLTAENQDLKKMYVQVFANNQTAINAYVRAGFREELLKTTENKIVLSYLPSNSKILMCKEV